MKSIIYHKASNNFHAMQGRTQDFSERGAKGLEGRLNYTNLKKIPGLEPSLPGVGSAPDAMQPLNRNGSMVQKNLKLSYKSVKTNALTPMVSVI